MNIEKRLSLMTSRLLQKPKTAGFLVFLILILIVVLIFNQRYYIIKENEHREMSLKLNAVKQNIDQSLKNSYTSSLTLALTINDDGIPKNFDTVAAQILSSNPSFYAVQLVPNGIIKYIYPLKGNEKALNIDVFKYSKRVAMEAKLTVRHRKMYFAGPIVLAQGWMGIVGRMPIYFNNKFWGFSGVVLKMDMFLKQAGINNAKGNKYLFQLSKVSLVTGKEEFFLPLTHDLSRSESETVSFPDGDWKIYLIPIYKYGAVVQLLPLAICAVLLAAIFGFLTYLLFKKPAELQLLVYAQASKLLSNEIKFKTIFDQAAIGIAEVNSNTGQFLQVNDKFCRILGYSEKELSQTNFQSITFAEDIPRDLDSLKQLKSGKIRECSFVKRYLHKDGHLVWSNIVITPLWAMGEEPGSNIAIVEDITEKYATERIAEEYRYRMESLINTIDGIVWESDPETFNFTFVSKKSESILGYTPEEWLSSATFWVEHIHPEDRDWVVSFCSNSSKKIEQHDLEYRMIAKNGNIVWLRDIVNVITEQGKPVLLRGIMIDVTRNKIAERDLNHSFDLVNEQNKRLLNFSYIVSHNLRSHTSNIQAISTLIDTASSDEERNEMVDLLKTVSTALNETLLNLNKVVNIQTNINIIIEPLNLRDYIIKTIDVLHDQIVLKGAHVINMVKNDIVVNYSPAYLESILLNFIFNAIRYSYPDRVPVVELSSDYEDKLLVLKIADNGIGMDLEKYGDQLFGMYKTFNGNPDSKGVGLFISKNQIDAMGGRVEVESVMNEGTTFRIYFK